MASTNDIGRDAPFFCASDTEPMKSGEKPQRHMASGDLRCAPRHNMTQRHFRCLNSACRMTQEWAVPSHVSNSVFCASQTCMSCGKYTLQAVKS